MDTKDIQLGDLQAQEITDMLLQYAPEGWEKVCLQFETNESFTRIDTWAETKADSHHGFRLEDADADELENLLTEVWDVHDHTWNTLDFSVNCDGNYEAIFS